jgi:hypothetical protein
VEVRGFVADIRTVLQGPGALVVPVRVGGGARTKVLEALACGMPVVSTALGVENLDLVPGRDFLLAETESEFVAAVSRLARDPELAAAIGREGAARAQRFRWSEIEGRVELIYRDAASGAGTARRVRSLAHAREARWDVPYDVAQLQADLARRHADPLSRALARTMRRLRRWGLVQRAETAAIRWFDRVLTPRPRA